MVSSTATLIIVVVAIFLLILFVIANLAKVVSYFRRTLERRAQVKNGPQKPVTPSEALARATQAANPLSGIAIPLSTLRASLPGQGATSSALAAAENPSSTVIIDGAPVLFVSEHEEPPIYAGESELDGCPERVVILPLDSTTTDVSPPSYMLSYLEQGQSRAA